MRGRKLQPVFVDLDECLVYAHDLSASAAPVLTGAESRRVGNFEVWLRPETREILQLLRAGGREVFLFTMCSFGLARDISDAFQLGFGEPTIFSVAMILNCRPNLCPGAVLIDNSPPAAENTRIKMTALGISPNHVWTIPAFEPPSFRSARLFLLGLPLRLARFDSAGSLVWGRGSG